MQKTLFSFLLSGDQSILFVSFNWSSKKELEKLKNSHFGQIQVQFVFCKISYRFYDERASIVNPHLTICHTELPCYLSEQHRWIIHSQLCSLCNTKIHFLIPILTVHCLQVWCMMRERALHWPRIRWPHPMPCNIFCKGGIETWDLGSFRYPQRGWKEWSN